MHADRGPRIPMRPILRPSARKFANLELAGVSGDGTFSGYASVFGEVDLGKDRIERGAFATPLSSAARAACACFTSTTRPSRSAPGQ